MSIRSPRIRSAAERRGIRTDDVRATRYEFATKDITITHWDGTDSVFRMEPRDYPPPCTSCGRS